MWSQLGVGLPNNNDDDEDAPQPSPGAGLWSRFVQVATDVAQDLAQPSGDDDDDEEEYEGEGGWDDGLGNQGWEGEEGQYVEGGEYYEEGGEQYYAESEEQYYQEGEPQDYQGEEHYTDEYQYDQEGGEYYEEGETGWGEEEEEVDFGLQADNETQDVQDPQPISDQPLFGGSLEHLQQQPATDDDQWDLEDEDLFGDVGSPQQEASEAYLEHQQQSSQQGNTSYLEQPQQEDVSSGEEPDGFLGDVVESNSGDNGWDQDESLNFDDSQHAGISAEAPAETLPEVVADQETEAEGWGQADTADDQGDGDGWNEDFGFDESQHVESPSGDQPNQLHGISNVVNQTEGEIQVEEAQAEGEGWAEDFGFDESQPVPGEPPSTEGASQQQETSDQETSTQFENAADTNINQIEQETEVKQAQAEGEGWDEDFGFDENQHGRSEHPSSEQVSQQPETSHQEQSSQDEADTNINQTEKETEVEEAQGEGEGWDEDLGFDDSQQSKAESQATSQPSLQQESTPQDPTALLVNVADTIVNQTEGETQVEEGQEETGGWGDDLEGLDDSHTLDDKDTNVPATLLDGLTINENTRSANETPGELKWNRDIDLNANQANDVQQGESAYAMRAEQETFAATGLEPPVSSDTLPADETRAEPANQEEGDGWNDSFGFDESQNLGDQQEGHDSPPVEQLPQEGEEANAGSLEDRPTTETPAEIGYTAEVAEQTKGVGSEEDAWNDDFGFDDSQNLAEEFAAANMEERSPEPGTVQGVPPEPESDSESKPTLQPNDDVGSGGDDDLNFSSHDEGGEEPSAINTEQVESDDCIGEANVPKEEDIQSSNQVTPDAPEPSDYQQEPVTEEPAQEGDAWGEDDLNFSSHDDGGAESGNPQPAVIKESLAAKEASAQEDAWNDSGLDFDEEDDNVPDEGQSETHQLFVSAVPGTGLLRGREGADGGDDDSTVEQSNIGVEQTSVDPDGEKPVASEDASGAELTFTLPGRTPSRRATIRSSNTSSARISRKDSEDDDSEPFNEKILGTSVMFADLTLGKSEAEKPTEQMGQEEIRTKGAIAEAGKESNVAADDVPMIRDTASSISDYSAEVPKPMFETQISLMTLKSLADSCPSHQRGNDSDEDDEDKFGPVVDKTPEISEEPPPPAPELSTMTINSTAVVAHSVNEDIQRDDDMDGTYYGGSTAAEGQSNENAWEEDDASSLGGLELGDKIVNFEMSANALGGSAPQAGDSIGAPIPDRIQEEVAAMTPPLNSSMAILYSDDNSVPSRDKDDDNEDDYKPVVDQIPKPLKKKLVTEKSGRTLNSLSVVADNIGAMTIKEGGEENGWDDDGASLEDIEGVEGAKDESEVVVDNTPAEACSTGGKSGGSLAAVESADNSCPSRVHDSDEEVYGNVVDKIPAPEPPLVDQMSVAASSMAVIAHNVEEDLKQDEELDASDHGGSTEDDLGVSSWDNDFKDLDGLDDEVKEEKDVSEETAPNEGSAGGDAPAINVEVSPDGDRVVDLTPKMEGRKVSRLSSNSLAVLASVAHGFGDNDEDEEDAANFGPIVDNVPTPQKKGAMTPNSTAVQASNIREDIKQDETTEGGVGDINWDDECPELEDMELGEEDEEDATESEAAGDTFPTSTNTQAQVVDHLPEGEAPRKLMGDASLAVLAPSEDGTCASFDDDDDDDNIDSHHRERVSYGPVVDTLPLQQPIAAPSTAPSVTFSLAVEARSVDEDFKLDDEMDETFCGDTTICEGAGENGWEDDQTLDTLDIDQSRRPAEPSSYGLPPSNSTDDTQVVDHTPQLDSPEPRMGDASLMALAPSVASTYHSADDAANDDDTITQEEDLYGKVVDHTPRQAPVPLASSASMAVGASSADFRSEMEREDDMDATYDGESTIDANGADGWGEDEKELDEIDTAGDPVDSQVPEEPVLVDHTPLPEEEGAAKSNNVDPSVAVLASRGDDNDTIDGNNVFGPVVDTLPPSSATVMSGSVAARHEGDLEQATLFGDSTVGADTGWDEDDAVLDDLVADKKEDESAGDASSRMEGSTIGKSLPDATSSQDGVNLVDHTPSEIDSSAQKNSVAWLVNVESGISGDETEDAGASWRGSSGQNARAEEDQVVDRIPQRPESRFGDASTLVVADPSEMLSHVGDMLQEEGDFGPVVDQTPPSRPGLQHAVSAAGSTVVVAPTIAPDDLDADPDDAINVAEDNDGWEQDPSELEQAPNPQSGNEEETARVREQVVDFLPPQEEQRPDQNRDGWSEVATGGAPSVFQADPKEDEFGPVVDQLPVPHPSTPFSAVSTASQVASDECEALAGEDETEDDSKQGRNANVVVDPLPRPFEVALQNLDSTASLAHSLASEDEDDDGKYGPVVDHLPSIRSSLPPSRGGSTVDALATVSEVIDDDDDDEGDGDASSEGAGGNDGWGDDDLGEIDISEHPDPPIPQPNADAADVQAKSRPDQSSGQMDKGMTVRFRSVVAAIFESSDTQKPADEGAGHQEDEPKTEPGQNFQDISGAGEASAWDDDLDFDVSLNADPNIISGNDSSMLSSPERYAQFAEADTPPATPYSRPKQARPDTDVIPPVGVALPDLTQAAATTLMQCNTCETANTIDCPCVQRILKKKDEGDDTIKIDYTKLLQTEIAKRLLISEESKDLRTQLERLKNSKSAGEVRMETVSILKEHVTSIEAKLNETRSLCDNLSNKNEELKASLDESKVCLTGWEERRKEWTTREAALRQEAAQAARDLDASLAAAKTAREQLDKELKEEREDREQAVGTLQHQLDALQTECTNLRANNSSLVADIQSSKDSLKEKQNHMSKLEKAAIAAQETSNAYEALKANFAAQESAYSKLQGELSSLQQRSQAADLEHRTSADQHQDEIARYQNELNSLQVRLDEMQGLRIQERQAVASQVEKLNEEVQRLAEENEVHKSSADELRSSGELAVNEVRNMLSQKQQELDEAFEQLGYLQEQNSFLEIELENLNSISEKAARLEEDLHVSNEEHDGLVAALTEANENVKRLQQRIENQGVEESVMERNKNNEIESLVAERANLRNTLATNSRQIQDLESHLSSVTREKDQFEQEANQLRQSCEEWQSTAERAQLEAGQTAEQQTKLIHELESLQQELSTVLEERDEIHMEREILLQRSKEMEASLTAAIEESDLNSERISELESSLFEAQNEAMMLKENNAALANERDQYVAKCQGLEQLLGDSSKASQEVNRLMHENSSLSEQARFIQQEFENQKILVQNYEARMAGLENELSAERNTNSAKDGTLSELKRELELTRANLEESAEGASELPQRIFELEGIVSRFEGERHDLEQRIALHSSREQEMQEVAQALTSDRDGAISDRDALARENEEMLVQFGLLNEKLEELQDVVQRYEKTTEINDAQLLELQERLTAAEKANLQEDEQRALLDDEDAAELMALRSQQSRLIDEIDALTNANSEKDTLIASITEELEGVQSQLVVLEELKQNSAALARENEELRYTVDDLEFQRNELDATCTSQAGTISGLETEIGQAREGMSLLESQVGMLEEACSSRDQTLQQKDTEMRELLARLHESSGSSSEATQEILDLRDRLSRMEASGQETADKLHSMTTSYEKSQQDLVSSMEQVSTLEAAVDKLEMDLVAKEEEASGQAHENQLEMDTLQDKLQSKSKEVAELTSRSHMLSREVDSLKGALEARQAELEAMSAGASEQGASSEELEALKVEMASLQEEMEVMKEDGNAREEYLKSEINDLKKSAASKDGEAIILKRRVQSLSEQLGESITQVQSKEDEILKLATELDALRQEQENVHKGVGTNAALLLQHTKQNAEDVENLRATVISLASALEASEGRRADAIDRLLRERETYADSLRHMSDSVKRFYNTLNCGD